MRFDAIVAGVGGQGVLLLASVLAHAAARTGLTVKQGEIHGMSQRGGPVRAHLRISDGPVHSDTIARGSAHLVLAVEPVEALRWAGHLAPRGSIVTSLDPVANIDAYPEMEEVRAALERFPRVILVEAERLAREAGSVKAVNAVMLGAAARLLPVPVDTIRESLLDLLAPRGEKAVEASARAFGTGLAAAAALAAGAGA